MLKRTVLLVVLLVTIVGSITAFAAEKPNYTIGFVVSSVDAEINAIYYEEVMKRIEEKGGKAIGVITNNDDERYIKAIENFTQIGVDGIIIGYGKTEAYKGAIAQANAKNIPVVGLYAGIVEGMLFDVASNDFALSAMVSKYMVDRLRASGGTEIAVFFSDGMAWSRRRHLALKAVLNEYTDIKVVAEHSVDWSNLRDDTMTATQNILLANPGLDAVWAIFDLPALAAASAIQQTPGANAFAVGIDGDQEALQMIAHTNVYGATVKQKPYKIAHTVVDKLYAYLNGDWEPLVRAIDVEGELVTKGNIDQYWSAD
ncbi:MAG: substrate-binding domain-containing protein [Halanaerobiales bacterium]|nr:substrate-binding domain-containing protein [Halanaerobiales bacterium]